MKDLDLTERGEEKSQKKNGKSENKPMHLQPVKFIVALVILFSCFKKRCKKQGVSKICCWKICISIHKKMKVDPFPPQILVIKEFK